MPFDYTNQRRSTNVDYGQDPSPSGWQTDPVGSALNLVNPMGAFDKVQQQMGWGQYDPNYTWDPDSLQAQAGINDIPRGQAPQGPQPYDATSDLRMNFEPNSGTAADYNAGNWKGFGNNGQVWDDEAGNSGDYGFDPSAPTQEMADEYKKGGTVKAYAGGGLTEPASPAGAPAGTGGSMPPPGGGGGGSGGAPMAQRTGNTQAGYIYTNPGGGVSYNGRPGMPGQQSMGFNQYPYTNGAPMKSMGFNQYQFNNGFNRFRGFGQRGMGFVDGGEVNDDLQANSDRDKITPNLNAALQTVDAIFKYGYQKHGLGTLAGDQDEQPDAVQGFDDGGEVEDDETPQQAIPTDDANGNEAAPANDPNGGWRGGVPTMDNVRRSMRSLPSPAEPFVQPVQKMLRMIQGADAMPIEQSIAHEAGAPAGDDNERKLMTAQKIAQQQGPDAAWSYLQALRKQFDLHRTNAAVKARKGDIANSTHAANKAMTNILDGMDTQFTPTTDGKGVRVRIKRVGQ